MNTLHQLNRDGAPMETICGMVLDSDIRDREDMLLATLEIAQDDINLNFGTDAVICGHCQGKAKPAGEEDNVICIVPGCECSSYYGG